MLQILALVLWISQNEVYVGWLRELKSVHGVVRGAARRARTAARTVALHSCPKSHSKALPV